MVQTVWSTKEWQLELAGAMLWPDHSWVVLARACRIANTLGAVQVPAHWRDAMQALHDEAMQR